MLIATPATPAASAGSAAAAPTPPPPAEVKRRPLVLGLALGGGAARGFAHIGVLQVLEEHGFLPQRVVGTSAGSLAAAMYASGMKPDRMAELALAMDESVLTDWSFPGRGLLKGEALARYVRDHTGGRAIEQMKIPLGIVATDLKSGEPALFRRGDVGTAVRASSAIPAVFQPVKIGQREFVDGGLVAPVPVRFVKQMGADFIVAVDISSAPEVAQTSSALSVLMQTFSIMGRSINQFELRDADVVIRPALNQVGSGDFSARKKSIAAGRHAMEAAMPELRRKWQQRQGDAAP